MSVHSFALSSAIVGFAAVSACSSMTPYASPARPTALSAPNSSPWSEQNAIERLSTAIDYAYDQEEIWRRKANLSANLQSTLYLTGAGTSSTAAYFGATGDRGTSAISALTFSAASIFGWSSFNQAKPKQKIYIAGTGAIVCLRGIASSVSVNEENYQILIKDTPKLSAAVDSAKHAADEMEASIIAFAAKYKEDPNLVDTLSPYKASLARFRAEINSAETTLSNTEVLIGEIENAGDDLIVGVDTVAAIIGSQLAEQQLSPEQAIQIAQDIGASAKSALKTIVPAKPVETPTSTPATEKDALTNQMMRMLIEQVSKATSYTRPAGFDVDLSRIAMQYGTLSSKVENLRGSKAAVSIITNSRYTKVQRALESASCNPEGAAKPLTINPDAEEIELQPGDSKTLTISGGSGKYTSSLSDKSGKVSISAAGENVVRADQISINTDADASGTFQVVVKDEVSSDSKTVTFKIVEKPVDDDGLGNLAEILQKITPAQPTYTVSGQSQYKTVIRPTAVVVLDSSKRLCGLSTTDVAIAQLAFLSSSPPNITTVGFVDGNWGTETAAAANHYFYDRTGIKRANTSKITCDVNHLLQSSDSSSAKFLSDAQRMRDTTLFFDPHSKKLDPCVLSQKNSLEECLQKVR